MFIKRLKVDGFKMIGEPLTINFPDGKNIIGIVGEEATGKSTVLQSILFALFGLHGQLGDPCNLITWNKEKAKTIIDFEIQNQSYRIHRIITKNGNQSARLMRVSSGTVDYDGVVEGVTDVREKVESLIGMKAADYSAFFAVREGDLQHFSNLSQSYKRYLVSKAFGIESFEQEIGKLIEDRNLVQNELERTELEFQQVSKNKQQYETRLAEKEELESTLVETMPQLATLKAEFEEAKSKRLNRPWHPLYDLLNQYLTSEIKKSADISQQQDELFKKKERLSRLEQNLNKYRSETKRVNSLAENQSLEAVNDKGHEKLQSARDLGNDMIQSSELGTRADTQKPKDVKVKQQYLTILLGLIVIGAALIVNSLFGNTMLFLAGTAAIIAAIFMGRLYDLVNKPSSTNNIVLSGDIAISLPNSDVKMDVGNHSGRKLPGDSNSGLSKIFTSMKSEIGEENIEQLESSLVKLRSEISELDPLDLQSRQDAVTRRITIIRSEISKLRNRKYEEKDHILSGERSYDDTQCVLLKTRFKKVHEAALHTNAILHRVEQELKLLQSDHDRFPILQNKLAELKLAILSLDKADKTLSETNAELMKACIAVLEATLNMLLSNQNFLGDRTIVIGKSLEVSLYSPKSGVCEPLESVSQAIRNQIVLGLRIALAHIALNTLTEKTVPILLLVDGYNAREDERNGAALGLIKAMEGSFSQILIASHRGKLPSIVDHIITLMQNNQGFTLLHRARVGAEV